MWNDGRAAGGHDAAGEHGKLRADARGLAHDDHGGPGAEPKHRALLAFRLEALLGEVRERALPPAHIAGRHGRTVASAPWPDPLHPSTRAAPCSSAWGRRTRAHR